MAEQRQPFRFRLPWLSAAAPAPRPTAPQPPRPVAAETQATTTLPIQRPPFRPAGRAQVQAPAQIPPRTEPPPSLPSRVAPESRVASQPVSPSRATQTRAASVPPSPTRGLSTETRTGAQLTSAPRPPAQTQIPSETKSPPRAPTQPRAASVPPSPSRTTSQPQPAIQPEPQPRFPSRFTSQPAVLQPHTPPKKPQDLTQSLSQEPQPKTQIKSEIISESQYQTESETAVKPDKMGAQPTQASGQVTATTLAAPESAVGPQKLESKPIEADRTISPSKEKKKEELMKGRKSADDLKTEKKKASIDEERGHRTVTEILTAAGARTKELLTARLQSEEKKQEQQEVSEREKPLTIDSSDEKQIKTISSTPKDRSTLGDTHQKLDTSNRERAPLHKQIKEDMSKFVNKLTIGQQKQPMDGKPVSIITLAGDNRGASMHIGSESTTKDESVPIHRGYKLKSSEIPESTTDGEGSSGGRKSRDPRTKEDQATKANINSNTQSINNSIVFDSSVSERNPGVQLALSYNLTEPAKPNVKPAPLESRKAEFTVTPAEKLTYEPTIRRRCLRGLFMEPSDSDPDNPDKPRRHGCLYSCGENNKDKDVAVL